MSSRSYPRRLAKRAEQGARRSLARLIGRLAPEPEPASAEEIAACTRILLIRPNFRIGNAAISTALVDCLRDRFPNARLDLLATDRTRAVLVNQPVDNVYALSRRWLRRPWRYWSLMRRLRGNHYDLAVQATGASLTATVITRLAGARYTMGHRNGNRRRYHVEVSGDHDHVYDDALNFARALGSSCRGRPAIYLTEAERGAARERVGTAEPGGALAVGFCGLFVGGRAEKQWPVDRWAALVRMLEERREPFVVFAGPEDRETADRLREAMRGFRHGALIEPESLRAFCGLLSLACCLITPDSGPMHLAAGLDVPVISLVRARVSYRYVPQGPSDRVLVDPDPAEVWGALRETADAQSCGGGSAIAVESPDARPG